MSEPDATHRRIVGYALIGLGALLVVVGIGLTIWQFWIVANSSAPAFAMRGIRASPESMSVQTTYVGAVLIAIGAMIAAAGSLLFRTPGARPNSG